jgi:hypothetical protein
MLTWFGLLTFGIFLFFFIMVGFRHRVKDASIVSGGAQIHQRTEEGEVHNHITKE